MDHKIRFFDDDAMPKGRDWMLCRQDSEVMILALRKSSRDLPDEQAAAVLEAAWAGYRVMTSSEVPTCCTAGCCDCCA